MIKHVLTPLLPRVSRLISAMSNSIYYILKAHNGNYARLKICKNYF